MAVCRLYELEDAIRDCIEILRVTVVWNRHVFGDIQSRVVRVIEGGGCRVLAQQVIGKPRDSVFPFEILKVSAVAHGTRCKHVAGVPVPYRLGHGFCHISETAAESQRVVIVQFQPDIAVTLTYKLL